MHIPSFNIAKEIPSSLGAQQTRLSLVSFQTYIEELTEGMQLEAFDEFSEYLMTCVKVGGKLLGTTLLQTTEILTSPRNFPRCC